MGLLTHENADIVIDAVEVIQELTDEDVGNEADDEEEGVEEALQALIRIFVRPPPNSLKNKDKGKITLLCSTG